MTTWRDDPIRTVWAGEAHLAELRAEQHALISPLRQPSRLDEVKALKRRGPVESLSALFILQLMEESVGLGYYEERLAA